MLCVFGCDQRSGIPRGSAVLLPGGSTGSEDLSLAHCEFVKEDFRPVTFCFQMSHGIFETLHLGWQVIYGAFKKL